MKKFILKGLLICASLLMGTVNANAQLSNILNKVVSAVTGNATTTSATIVGTWTYAGSAVEFTSDNLLTNLGSTALSTKVEKKVNSYLSKIGMKAGKFTLALNEDKTFTTTLASGRTSSGTYTLTDGTLSLTFTTTGATFNTTAQVTGNTMEILMDASRMLSLMSTVANAASGNSTISAISTLLGQYSGMKLGMKFTK